MEKERGSTAKLNSGPSGRLANLELLRIIAMMLVVVLHFWGKGGWLMALTGQELPRRGYLVWGIEALAIVAVNVYMLLSGYFLTESTFKVKRLVGLLLQIWFYSVCIGIVAAAFGYLPEEGFTIYYLVQLCLPVSTGHYWFMTAYVTMYLFAPLLAQGVKRLSKKQFQTVLLLLLLVFCVMKSVIPVKLAADMRGYDGIWYLCVFLVAAYIRLYGLPFFRNAWRSLLVYLACAAGIFGVTFLLRAVYLRTGKLESVLTICYDYNHILVLLASVAFFYLFYHIRLPEGRFSRLVCRVAPCTLGVYLLHEHVAIRYEWPDWLYAFTGKPESGAGLLLLLLLAVVLVFMAGVILDMARRLLFGGIHRLFSHMGWYRRLYRFLDELTIGTKKEAIHE